MIKITLIGYNNIINQFKDFIIFRTETINIIFSQ